MKKVNCKKGLSALMAATMGLSMFAATGAGVTNATREGLSNIFDNNSSRNQTMLRQNRQNNLRNQRRNDLMNEMRFRVDIEAIKNNFVIPAFKQFNIEFDEDDLVFTAALLSELNFNIDQLQLFINTLTSIMRCNQINSQYLINVYTSFVANQNRVNDGNVETLIGLCNGRNDKYGKIKNILEIMITCVNSEE